MNFHKQSEMKDENVLSFEYGYMYLCPIEFELLKYIYQVTKFIGHSEIFKLMKVHYQIGTLFSKLI